MISVRSRFLKNLATLVTLVAISICATNHAKAEEPGVALDLQFYCTWRLDCVNENGEVEKSFGGNGDAAPDCPTARDNAWFAAEMCSEGLTCEGCGGLAPRIYISECKEVQPFVRVPTAPRGLWVVEYTIRTRGGGHQITISVEGVSYCDTKQQIDRFICKNLQKAPFCGACRPLGVRVLQRPNCCSCCTPRRR